MKRGGDSSVICHGVLRLMGVPFWTGGIPEAGGKPTEIVLHTSEDSTAQGYLMLLRDSENAEFRVMCRHV